MTQEGQVVEEEVPQQAPLEADDTQEEVIEVEEGLQELPLDQLVPHSLLGGEMRDPEIYKELVEDIRLRGLNQPILVNPIDINKYEIVAGYNRYKAVKEINESDVIKALVKVMNDQESAERCFIDNILHQNLLPYLYEEGVYKLNEKGKYKTIKELAKKLHKSDTWISKNIEVRNIRKEILQETRDELFKDLGTEALYQANMIREYGVDLRGLVQFLKKGRMNKWSPKRIGKEVKKYSKMSPEKQYKYLYGNPKNKSKDIFSENEPTNNSDDSTDNQEEPENENKVVKFYNILTANLQPELKSLEGDERQKALDSLKLIINYIGLALVEHNAITQQQYDVITEITSTDDTPEPEEE